jgi:dUTPase
MKYKKQETVITEVELDVEFPYYAKTSPYSCAALLSESRMVAVAVIDEDYRSVLMLSPNEDRIRGILNGKQITQEEFKAFYQQAITDIDEQTPCSDLKLSDPLPAIPY